MCVRLGEAVKIERKPDVSTLNSEWSLNSFIMVVCENFFQVQSEFSVESTAKKRFFTDGHSKTNHGPVRTECTSVRVVKIYVK